MGTSSRDGVVFSIQHDLCANASTNVVDSMEVLYVLILDRKVKIVFEAGWYRLTLTDDRGSLQSGQCGRNGKFCRCNESYL